MNTVIFKVTGMTCGGCVNSVKKALKARDGVSEVEVELSTGATTVHFDEQLASPAQLKLAITDAGYGVDDSGAAQKPQAKGGCCCG